MNRESLTKSFIRKVKRLSLSSLRFTIKDSVQNIYLQKLSIMLIKIEICRDITDVAL